MKRFFVIWALLVFILMPTYAAKKKKNPDNKTGNVTCLLTPDTISVIHNPCTGWAIYTDGYIPSNPSQYFADMDKCGALRYANILYMRLPWAMLEPEEGHYAWNENPQFMEMVREAKARHIKLAFRVYCDNKDYRIPISPRYLIDAGAKGYLSNTNIWTPYADDPVFLAKFDKFVEAFGKEFNDPDVTDFIDGWGMGIWGEGFGLTYLDSANKDKVLYHVAGTYAKNFPNVIVAINAHKDIGNDPLMVLADKDDFIFRHDAIGSREWFEPSQSKLMIDCFPEHFTIAESMWWLSQGPNTSIYTNEGFHDWREVMDFTYQESERIRANVLDLRNVAEASTLWMSQASDLVENFNRRAGYRLTPTEIVFPSLITAGKPFTIDHTWRNSGWGVCPNNNTHWGFKYKTAFALLPTDSDEPVCIIVDENGDPSQWLMEKDTHYTLNAVFNVKAGEYRLAVGIVDTTKDGKIGLKLAVADHPAVAGGWIPVGNVTVSDDTEDNIITGSEYPNVHAGKRPKGISDLSLWYDAPATKSEVEDKWMEFGLCIGNGQLGAVLLGGLLNDEIQFNEKTLWEGSANNVDQGYYQNFGFLNVTDQSGTFANTAVQDYARYLDIERGVAGVTYRSNDTQYKRTYVASAPDSIIAAHYTAKGRQKLQLHISFRPDKYINAGNITYTNGEGTFSGKLTTICYDARFRVESNGTVIANSSGVNVINATWVTVYLAACTNFDGTSDTSTSRMATALIKDNTRVLADAASKGWEAIFADHVNNFSSYMNRVDVDLNGALSRKDTKTLIDLYADEDKRTNNDGLFLEKLYYQFGRYLTVACNNINTIGVPSNLQGIWNIYSNSPFWHCDIHSDINVEMNYWPSEAANLSEMHLPFLDYIINNSDDTHYWHKLAQHYHPGVEGWMIGYENNIFGGASNWQTDDTKTLNGWYCQHLWQHYRYTQDRDFLKRAFPTMYGAAQFLMGISSTDRDGTIIIPNEWSPEHGPFHTVTAFAQQVTAECIHECIEAAEILGTDSGLSDADVSELQNYYEAMDRGLHTEIYDGKSCLKEWKYYGLNEVGTASSHRHMSHLMALYPFNHVSPYDDDTELYQATRNALFVRNSTDVTGWSMAWRVNLYARTLDADMAHDMINLALHHSTRYDIQMSNNGGVYYNLWDAHTPFEIDGNFGVTAGINEMLLQSYDGTVHVLPALPTVWPNGCVKGLKAVGNFTVNEEWADGKATRVTIQAGSHYPLSVSIPDIESSKVVVLLNGKRINTQPEGNTYRVGTKPGDTVTFKIRNK